MKIVIVGSDATLIHVCRSLTAKNADVVIICSEERQARLIAKELGIHVLIGSGADASLLEAAGVEQADCLLAMAPNDADNMVSCRLAKTLFRVQRCFALVHDPQNEGAFVSLGADVTFSIAGFLADQLAVGMTRSGVVRQIPFADSMMVMVEVVLPHGAVAVGRILNSIASPHVHIAVVLREGQPLAEGDALHVGDYLAITTESHRLGSVLDSLLGKSR